MIVMFDTIISSFERLRRPKDLPKSVTLCHNTRAAPRKDRGNLLRILAVSGFAQAFEALVNHERVGQVEGVLDEGGSHGTDVWFPMRNQFP